MQSTHVRYCTDCQEKHPHTAGPDGLTCDACGHRHGPEIGGEDDA